MWPKYHVSYSVVIVKDSCAAKVLLAVRLLLSFLSVEEKNGGTLAVPATLKHTAETRGQSQISHRSPFVVKATYFPHFFLSTLEVEVLYSRCFS